LQGDPHGSPFFMLICNKKKRLIVLEEIHHGNELIFHLKLLAMNKLAYKTGFIGFVILMIVSGCSQNSIFKAPAVKIQGKWRYETVKFRPYNSFVNQNITDQYFGDVVEFNSDNSLSKFTQNDTLPGTWSIQDNSTADTNQGQSLVMALSNSNGTVTISYLTNLYIGSKKITAYENRGDGTYYYVLKR